ncbi:stemmadenine O-acetyltransferase-like [Punica granatum]|uniref:Stemmadenine O-acetyltransferase-like n=1 Tax=Punica granatum TaxID=22663 RepID=A0A218WCJ7_PUNGR|nr:stemmadenine O-acetyltransferase-like [Punica granatum]OWM70587.1 hypothetical protein CDL15_Pgr014260 [Punica granatum]
MEVKITSKELVKPSSRTPRHLRTFKLSLLDQLIYAPVTPFILFYPSNSEPNPLLDVRQKLNLLKKSLSQTLCRFYPLAGIIQDDLTVECDDGGAHFIEATVNLSLSQFLANPDLILLNKFVPSGLRYAYGDSLELTRAANIQVNVFRCGGLAIGICNPHRLQDGTAIGTFLMEWAAAARSGSSPAASWGLVVSPAQLFPVKDLCLRDKFLNAFNLNYKRGKCVRQRFLFSRSSIEALRARGSGPIVKNPTRVEAVSGFLWKCAMAASERKNNGLRRPSVFTQFVNIRKRINPPSSKFYLGNFIWLAIAKCHNIDSYNDMLPSLVSELRRAVDKIDTNFCLTDKT